MKLFKKKKHFKQILPIFITLTLVAVLPQTVFFPLVEKSSLYRSPETMIKKNQTRGRVLQTTTTPLQNLRNEEKSDKPHFCDDYDFSDNLKIYKSKVSGDIFLNKTIEIHQGCRIPQRLGFRDKLIIKVSPLIKVVIKELGNSFKITDLVNITLQGHTHKVHYRIIDENEQAQASNENYQIDIIFDEVKMKPVTGHLAVKNSNFFCEKYIELSKTLPKSDWELEDCPKEALKLPENFCSITLTPREAIKINHKNDIQKYGKSLKWVVLVVPVLALILNIFLAYFQKLHLSGKLFRFSLFFQFISKLPLIQINFGGYGVLFMDELMKIDCDSFDFFNEQQAEFSKMKGGIKGKFYEYWVPVMATNSIRIPAILLLLCFFLEILTFRVKSSRYRFKAVIRSVLLSLISYKFLDVVFYSLYSVFEHNSQENGKNSKLNFLEKNSYALSKCTLIMSFILTFVIWLHSTQEKPLYEKDIQKNPKTWMKKRREQFKLLQKVGEVEFVEGARSHRINRFLHFNYLLRFLVMAGFIIRIKENSRLLVSGLIVIQGLYLTHQLVVCFSKKGYNDRTTWWLNLTPEILLMLLFILLAAMDRGVDDRNMVDFYMVDFWYYLTWLMIVIIIFSVFLKIVGLCWFYVLEFKAVYCEKARENMRQPRRNILTTEETEINLREAEIKNKIQEVEARLEELREQKIKQEKNRGILKKSERNKQNKKEIKSQNGDQKQEKVIVSGAAERIGRFGEEFHEEKRQIPLLQPPPQDIGYEKKKRLKEFTKKLRQKLNPPELAKLKKKPFPPSSEQARYLRGEESHLADMFEFEGLSNKRGNLSAWRTKPLVSNIKGLRFSSMNVANNEPKSLRVLNPPSNRFAQNISQRVIVDPKTKTPFEFIMDDDEDESGTEDSDNRGGPSSKRAQKRRFDHKSEGNRGDFIREALKDVGNRYSFDIRNQEENKGLKEEIGEGKGGDENKENVVEKEESSVFKAPKKRFGGDQ